MAETDPILAKADALMRRRHRVFVAQGAQVESVNEPAAATDDEDLPLLTEIVAAEELVPTPSAPTGIDPTVIRKWIDEELPSAVFTVLDGVTDRLVEVLTEKMRRELVERNPTDLPR